jgi:hypothetical protein
MAQVMKIRQTNDPKELRPITEEPAYQEVLGELNKLRGRLAAAERRRAVALARSRGQRSTTSPEARTQALMAGGRVSAAPPEAELAAADEEIAILKRGEFAAIERLGVVVGELSHIACTRMRAAHDDGLRAALAAATALHAALEGNREIRGRLVGSGYQLLDGALAVHAFPRAAMLGDPNHSGSAASDFREWLLQKGIIR